MQYLLSNLVRKFCSSEKGSLKLIHYHCSDKRTMMRIKNTSTCNTTQALQHTVLSTIYVEWLHDPLVVLVPAYSHVLLERLTSRINRTVSVRKCERAVLVTRSVECSLRASNNIKVDNVTRNCSFIMKF